MSIVPGATGSGSTNLVINPLDGGLTAGQIQVPYGFLILGAGQFSSSITPAGSGRTPVVRAYPKFKAPISVCVGTAGSNAFVLGKYLYTATSSDKGKFTITAQATGLAGAIPVGICTHVPTAAEPWLGVAAVI